MKFKKPYRTIRIAAASIFTTLTVGAFAGIGTLALVPRLQFGPAYLASFGAGFSAAAVTIIAVTLVATLLFGRFYCAAVCPWGVLQDFLGWLAQRKNSPKKNHFLLRYAVGFLAFGLLAGGSVALFRFLDPYSNFGSIMAALIKPSAATGLGALSPFLLLLILTLWKRRLFCVALCPIGTLLGIGGKWSLFRLSVSDACAGCGLCEKVCPVGCVDAEKKFVDNERCVRCLNCLSVCQRDAIRYGLFSKTDRKKIFYPEEALFGSGTSRRRYLFASLWGFLALGFAGEFVGRKIRSRKEGAGDGPIGESHPILPPGADVSESFSEQCVNCGHCASVCPGKAIHPAPWRSGPVQIQYDAGFCEFDCVDCGTVCPTGALRPLKPAEKQRLAIGLAAFDPQYCVAVQDNIACGGCAEDCPTAAIVIQLSPTFFPIPRLDPNFCLGCGACLTACRREHEERTDWKGKTLALKVTGLEKQTPVQEGETLREAIRLIRNNGAVQKESAADCVLIQNGKIAARESAAGHGVSPLFALMEKEGEQAAAGTIVDKVIGRAAAAIIIQAKAASAYGELMSEDAVSFLTLYGVEVGYTRLVPKILNRNRDGLCPLEKAVEGIDDPAEAVEALKKSIAEMK